MPNITTLERPLKEAVAEGKSVKILVLHKDSAFAAIRASETRVLHPTTADFIARSNNDTVVRLAKICDDIGDCENLEIRTYDRSPGICIYGTERAISLSPYLTDTDAVNAPSITLFRDSPSYDVFLEHYEKIWQGGQPINFKEYLSSGH